MTLLGFTASIHSLVPSRFLSNDPMEDTVVQLLKRTEEKLVSSNVSIAETFQELKWQLLCVMSMSLGSDTLQTSLSQMVPKNLNDLNTSVCL